MNNNFWKIVALALVLAACKSTPTDSSSTRAGGSGVQQTASPSSATGTKGADLDKLYAAYLSNRQIYFDYDSDSLKSAYMNLN